MTGRIVLRFVARRMLIAVVAVLGILFVTFMLIRIGNLDPVAMLGGPTADRATLEDIARELELDRPVLEQFWRYLVNLAHGNLGHSWQSSTEVLDDIVMLFPRTLELTLLAVGLGALVGIPVGVRAATRPNALFDQVSRFGSLLGFSIPTYWMGTMAIFLFFFLLGWAPAPMGVLPFTVFPPPPVTGSLLIDCLLAGDFTALRAALGYLALPVCCFAIIAAAPIIKQTRAVTIEILGSDHVRYARACGFPDRVVRRIAMRGALVPVLTFVASELTSLLAAASLIEYIFSRGGLGQWGLNAILLGDFAAVQAYVLTLALFAVAVFLVVDLLVLLLDPRLASMR